MVFFSSDTSINPVDLGLYYLNSRFYDAEIGRFINADSEISGVGGELLGYNMYTYCFNNPVNWDDSDGNWPKWAKKVAIGVAVIAAAAIVTVATAGAASGTLLAAVHCVAVGALNGAVAGAAVGAVTGAVKAAVKHRVTTGSWNGAGTAARDGAADGFMSGAITGAITGGATSNACFVAGTAVLTAIGYSAIEEIKAGDKVWSENPETGEKGLKEVVRTFVNETDELVHVYVDGEEIIITPEHPFYAPKKGWVRAIDLRAGDILVLQSGEYVVVELIQHEILESPITVYNFEVEDFHTYYVGNSSVLVHNRCGTVPTKDLTPTHALTNSKNQMNKLINDIRVNGIQETIKYVDFKGTKYIVDGHYRVAAAQALGITNVPAIEVSLPYAGYKSVIDLFW